MLLSQKEERSRRFTLALRAGIPILLLVFLMFYATHKDNLVALTIGDGILISAVTFITIYFIYFLMNLSVKETLIDATTQGFTKKALIEKIQHSDPKSLICLNIENLASLNENYGSEQIDILLYTVTHKLHLIFKQYGFKEIIIGRHRGSEFLIALESNKEDIESILKEMIENNKQINDIEVSYKFAIITNVHNDFEKNVLLLNDLIHTDENSDYQKDNNAVIKDASEVSNIETDIINAIKSKTLLLSFRPILNTQTEKIDHYEISIKLKSSNNKDILPKVFLPIINRLGLGREYDFLIITHIVDLLPLIDENIAFTFNLSPFSLRDKPFQNSVFEYLEKSKVNPSRLIIQLYERKTHHDLSNYLKVLANFRARGIRICIDNFGSSSASMEYIKHFKFDMVQFDRSYVTKLEDKTTYAMLNSLIHMTQDLEVKTIAKWVDKEKQKEALIDLGINYLQGFGIGSPIDETTLIEHYN